MILLVYMLVLYLHLDPVHSALLYHTLSLQVASIYFSFLVWQPKSEPITTLLSHIHMKNMLYILYMLYILCEFCDLYDLEISIDLYTVYKVA